MTNLKPKLRITEIFSITTKSLKNVIVIYKSFCIHAYITEFTVTVTVKRERFLFWGKKFNISVNDLSHN